MEAVEKYFKSIMWMVFIAVLIMGIIGEVVEDEFTSDANVIALTVRITEIFIISLINILIIKKVADKEEKGIKFTTYFKTVLVSIIVAIITSIAAYILVQIKPFINNLLIWGVLAILMYILKILLSFAIYIIVLEDLGPLSSILHSIKITINKENIFKILLANIGFIIILFVPNLYIKTIDTLIAIAIMEIFNYIVFILNEKLYLKCKYGVESIENTCK